MKSNNIYYFCKNKRNFLLIEIIIALAIISLLTIPLIKNPIYYFKSQINSFTKIEYERIADLTFFEIKLLFHSNPKKIIEIKEKEIKNSEEHQLSPKTISITDKINKKIQRSYKLSYKEKITSKNETFKLVTVQVRLREDNQIEPNVYIYNFIAKKQ